MRAGRAHPRPPLPNKFAEYMLHNNLFKITSSTVSTIEMTFKYKKNEFKCGYCDIFRFHGMPLDYVDKIKYIK